LKARLAALFLTRTRDEWCVLMEGTDVCFAPVLDWDEAPRHPHNLARETFIDLDGVTQPGPAPRFSRTPPARPTAPVRSGSDSEAILRDWGIPESAIAELKDMGAI
jgi:alpha-methylacyl-CoA racemase